jgi:hypothetical protein
MRPCRRLVPAEMHTYGSLREFRPERFPAHGVIYSARQLLGEVRMPARSIKLPSDGVMADVCLGVTVTSLYTLVGLGLVIAFM